MRFVRQMLEVIVPQSETDDSVDVYSKDNFSEVCFNVFRVADNGDLIPPSTKFSLRKLYLLSTIKDYLMKAKCGMARIGQPSSTGLGGNGTCFYLLPNVVITNSHVANTDEIPLIYTGTYSEAVEGYFQKLNPVESKLLFSGSSMQHQMRKYNHSLTRTHFPQVDETYLDPIISLRGDFGYMDISLHKIAFPNNMQSSKVLMIPCPEILQVSDPIFTMHYPGVEGTQFSSLHSNQFSNYLHWAPNDNVVSDLFHGYGKLCISTGKVLAPYVEEKQENGNIDWVPNTSHQYNSQNSNFLITNESVTIGSSGGCVQSPTCRVIEINGITLVEFHAIHFGGQFVKCKNCLKHIKQQMNENDEDEYPSLFQGLPQEWNFCEACQNGKESSKMVYNYSVSVHHPLLKQVYKKLIAPDLLTVLNVNLSDERLERLKQYLDM
ncbi:predicted protein [Naegleria gruberi]|uniref:Predicted protein n=1 Tax=Naegleria gruberi TaxID=5762 RepID=D2VW92_NAEGR|nr:uncharacterized protein NAEGRDRAFT_73298 [Naegleria gruberi]EFC38788.1 predicted protein [Naegleria gruberi]|eukprot:XP_002671532.1 predicted protein [Naegleria gruberi strain NEG-M]